MRPKRIVLALLMALLVIAATAGAGFVWFKNAPRRTPPGQPALSHLSAASLPTFREAFNELDQATRVIVLLSPT